MRYNPGLPNRRDVIGVLGLSLLVAVVYGLWCLAGWLF